MCGDRTLQGEGDGLLELLKLLGEGEVPRRRRPGARHGGVGVFTGLSTTLCSVQVACCCEARCGVFFGGALGELDCRNLNINKELIWTNGKHDDKHLDNF